MHSSSAMQAQKNTSNIAGGHKAALKNPNVSEEAKERSQQALEEMRERGALPEQHPEPEKDSTRFISGHKATLKNPRVSEEAREHSREVLDEYTIQI